MKNTKFNFELKYLVFGKSIKALALMLMIFVSVGFTNLCAQSYANSPVLTSQQVLAQTNLINDQQAVVVLKEQIAEIKSAVIIAIDANGRTINDDLKREADLKIGAIRDVVISMSQGVSLEDALQNDIINKYLNAPRMQTFLYELLSVLEQ